MMDHQPNENTALLQSKQQTRHGSGSEPISYRQLVDGEEEDSLLAHNGSSSVFIPGGLKVVSPECMPEGEEEEDESDQETNGSPSAREPPPTVFLINTHPRQFRMVFSGIMLTYFIANFDSTIMASSHPVITSHFHASNMASWLTTAFLLTSTAFQPLAGRLSDTLGRKPLYLASMVVFGAATAWCALAGSIMSFIAARAVCGLGAGGMMTLGAIAVSDCVPIERRGNYQSIINIIYGLASSSGAAFGGLMADTLGWRWEFGIQLFPLALCLVTAYLSMPDDLGIGRDGIGSGREGGGVKMLVRALRGFDFGGSVLLTASTTFLILGLNLGGNVLPWSHPFIIVSLVIFSICFPACLYVESRVERPIMPLALLRSSPRANIIFSNFFGSFLLNAILFNAPLFFRAVLQKTATESGLYLVLPTASASLTGTLTGILISRTGHLKWPLQSGTVLFLLGTVLLSLQGQWPLWAHLACLVPTAVGQGFQFPGAFMAVLAASTQAEQAVVTSTLQLWRALGNVLGVACSSLVFQNALLRCLWLYVSAGHDGAGEGEEWKREFIERVRTSIEAVTRLPEGRTKDEVIRSYAAACRATFLVCVGVAALSILLILPVRLPRLGRK